MKSGIFNSKSVHLLENKKKVVLNNLTYVQKMWHNFYYPRTLAFALFFNSAEI